MAAYSEKPICSLGVPIIDPNPCPSALLAPAPENLPITISMGNTSYLGTLRTDIPDRVTRTSALVLELWRRFNHFNFALSTVFSHTFKYPVANNRVVSEPDKEVRGSAFAMTHQMLVEIDKKLNSLVLDIEDMKAVASIPEHWQIRPEANRPIAVFLFGEWEPGAQRIESPKWQICVPHPVLSAIVDFDNTFGYTKGSIQYCYTLSDNSKIIFYGNNSTEMTAVLARWRAIIDPNYLEGAFLKSGPIKGLPFSIRRLRLVRIDYYAQGILKSTPTNYIKFSRRPKELPPLPG